MSYQPRRVAQLDTLRIRGLEFQLYRWVGIDPVPLVLVHGWGDSGETFQFLVDALSSRRTLLAFDARGFGRTQWPEDGYWFPDYLADLDALLAQISPHQPVDLIGHSMGANVTMLYAGIRPQRVRRLAALEGFGMAATQPAQAPARYREWLDEVRDGTRYATYDSFEQFAAILARRNPRTTAERLDFIARSWGQRGDGGRITLRADPRHKRVNPVLYQREQAEACWREIAAPLLFVIGGLSDLARRIGNDHATSQQLTTLFRDIDVQTIADAGHMLHHEQPAAVAELLERFFVD